MVILTSETVATLERVVAAFVLNFKILLGYVTVLQAECIELLWYFFIAKRITELNLLSVFHKNHLSR